MFTATAVVTKYTLLVTKTLPQTDSAFFGVAGANKFIKVHNQRYLDTGTIYASVHKSQIPDSRFAV